MRGAKNIACRDLIARTPREGAMTQFEKRKKINSNYTFVKGIQYGWRTVIYSDCCSICGVISRKGNTKASDGNEDLTKESSYKILGSPDGKTPGLLFSFFQE